MLSADLPEEIMQAILTRLPVKSLIRFKFVAKSWKEQIANPSFIARQLELSNSVTGKSRLRLILNNDMPRISLISDREPIDIEVPFPEKDDVSLIFVYGQCNGIFCLYGLYGGDKAGRSSLILWNPGTREVKVLPASHNHSRGITFGFGIDPVTKDYKVVKLGYLIFPGIENAPVVELYNLSTDSWRTVDSVVNAYRLGITRCKAYLNGFYHWLIQDNNDSGILFFDFTKELFGRIQLPPEILARIWVSYVAVIDEKLACVVAPYNMKSSGFEIWVMNEYGVEGSWSKKFYNASQRPEFGFFLGFWGDGDEILVDDGRGELVSYNLKNTQISRFDGIRGIRGMFKVFDYMESLIPLNTENIIN